MSLWHAPVRSPASEAGLVATVGFSRLPGASVFCGRYNQSKVSLEPRSFHPGKIFSSSLRVCMAALLLGAAAMMQAAHAETLGPIGGTGGTEKVSGCGVMLETTLSGARDATARRRRHCRAPRRLARPDLRDFATLTSGTRLLTPEPAE